MAPWPPWSFCTQLLKKVVRWLRRVSWSMISAEESWPSTSSNTESAETNGQSKVTAYIRHRGGIVGTYRGGSERISWWKWIEWVRWCRTGSVTSLWEMSSVDWFRYNTSRIRETRRYDHMTLLRNDRPIIASSATRWSWFKKSTVF